MIIERDKKREKGMVMLLMQVTQIHQTNLTKVVPVRLSLQK